jgi:hypothetical protein
MSRAASILGFLLLTTATIAPAQELSYRLPKATLAAGWQARLEGCPEATTPPLINAQPAIVGAYSAGQLIRLNPSNPFLGSRNIALTYHENETLKTINADGTGSAGSILASLFKAGAGFLALGPAGAAASLAVQPKSVAAGPRPPGAAALTCRPEVKKKVDRWHALRSDISAIEARMVAGETLPSLQQSLYERMKTEFAEVEKGLLLSTSFKWEPDPAGIKLGKDAYEHYGVVKPIDYSKWFVQSSSFTPDKGTLGFCARFTVKPSALQSSLPVPTFDVRKWKEHYLKKGALRTNIRHDRFVYLRPVPVEAELREIAGEGTTATIEYCKVLFADKEQENLASKTVNVPQLSDYFILPLSAGMLGSRSTAAEFTADGRIVSLSTKADGGGAGIAEALAGALTAAETVRDADTKALQRRLDREKVESELDKLLHPSPTSTVAE